MLVLVALEIGFASGVGERVFVGFSEGFKVAVLRCPEAMFLIEEKGTEVAIEVSFG